MSKQTITNLNLHPLVDKDQALSWKRQDFQHVPLLGSPIGLKIKKPRHPYQLCFPEAQTKHTGFDLMNDITLSEIIS